MYRRVWFCGTGTLAGDERRSGFVAPALLPVTKKKVWFCGSGISCGDLEMVCFG
jgi:hypothetical protein